MEHLKDFWRFLMPDLRPSYIDEIGEKPERLIADRKCGLYPIRLSVYLLVTGWSCASASVLMSKIERERQGESLVEVSEKYTCLYIVVVSI